MFLGYGVNSGGELIRVEQVERGRQPGIFCPYCRRPLIAKKGQINAAHFAHDGDTCREADRAADVINLPAYDRFNLHLSPRELQALLAFTETGEANKADAAFRHLQQREMIKFNDYRGRYGGWELTNLGKIPPGKLSLLLFNDLQESMIREQHTALERAAYQALGSADFGTALTDLRLYRAQWRRILSLTLYFMEITHTGGRLHKIGVTSRSADERATEVAHELHAAGVTGVSIKVVETWEHRGNVELYFKHRYAAHRAEVGTLTEYFTFPDPAAVVRDLKRMKPKILDGFERDVLVGEAAPIELRMPPGEPLTLEQWDVLNKLPLGEDQPAETPDTLTAEEYQIVRFLNDRTDLTEFGARGFSGQGMQRAVYLSQQGRGYLEWFAPFYADRFADAFADRQHAQEEAERIERRRSAIRAGMERAAATGQHVGRPPLEDERAGAIRAAVQAGMSLRQIAAETGAAINTIRRIKAKMIARVPEGLTDEG